MSRLRGWTFDPMQQVYLSPDRRYAAQRERGKRWSLWFSEIPVETKLTGMKTLSDWHRSLAGAQDAAEKHARGETE